MAEKNYLKTFKNIREGQTKGQKRGFTLIELVVVLAVFLFILGAAVAIFISIIQSQKKVLAQQEVLNQLSYVQEYMSKALRMAKAAGSTGGNNSEIDCMKGNAGFIYLLTRPTASGIYRGVRFLNQSGSDPNTPICQEFFVDNLVSGDTSTPLVLKELKGITSDTTDEDAVPLTSESLQIDPTNPVRFSINGADGSILGSGCVGVENSCGAKDEDIAQPKITIIMSAKISGDTSETPRTVQTTVSQRNLNVK